MAKMWVMPFSSGITDKTLLGGKGANLAEMTAMGLPVPAGFTITTQACTDFFAAGNKLSQQLKEEVIQAVADLEQHSGKVFGGDKDPLLVSVRSGAPVSMPGMMDTVLNLGLNDQTVEGLAGKTGDRRFAMDCYRRFIQMFGDVVMQVPHHDFEAILSAAKSKAGVRDDTQLDEEMLCQLVEKYKQLIYSVTRSNFPQQPLEQLYAALMAVFSSWNNNRAQIYRRINKIPDHYGTAVNVQQMVFGNSGDNSGTGVLFTRDPSTGENNLYGEFLINAQGEDVVSGTRTPRPITEISSLLPEAWAQLVDVCKLLEQHYGDMQDIEFTVEHGRLFMLQTRRGKRTARAAVKIAVDMVGEGLLSKEQALSRVDAHQLANLLHRQVSPDAVVDVLATGLPASPGAACGVIVFDSDEAEKLNESGQKVILIRPETTPDDIHGIVAAQGILTSRGGMTSHAAVVARGMGKPCVCGCEGLQIDLATKTAMAGGRQLKAGDLLSLDGATGRVIWGQVPLVEPEISPEFSLLLDWADQFRKLGVRANADNPADARKAREFGAQGIGLCRTEHMFMDGNRLPIVQQMILADNTVDRQQALDRLMPIQLQDFYEIFQAMDGLPVTIRLLDPPLHEFLPSAEKLAVEVALMEAAGQKDETLSRKKILLRQVRNLEEANPMLGNRGCRLGLIHPEIYNMQAEAIFRAAARLQAEGGDVRAEIMIPLVSHFNELQRLRQQVEVVHQQIENETGEKLEVLIGTMIELPRACVTAHEIAAHADFFSFGTNDLTQTTFGFSRDDAEGKVLPAYIAEKILAENPFAVLDRDGVGKLMSIAVTLGRQEKSNLKLGICGEHGGDPNSIEFCHMLGMDYVSCSPYRVPVARLAAAQAALSR